MKQHGVGDNEWDARGNIDRHFSGARTELVDREGDYLVDRGRFQDDRECASLSPARVDQGLMLP